ncbi:MAG: hypothetical protein ACRC8K_09390 [Waterburya sp.]
MSTEVIVYKEPQPISVVTQILRGERGAANVTAIAPLQADSNGQISIQNYVFTQNMNLAEWLIVHNLNKPYPSITIKDGSNETLIGELTAINNNTLRINFNTPEMGTAYLS